MIRNLIPRKIRNRFPNFNGWVKLVTTHGQGLLNRLRLWEEPLSLFPQGCGSFCL
jgi:hypothetical protein